MKNKWAALAAVCALVIGVYASAARSGVWDSLSPTASASSYNLLVQGFRAGQLSLKKDVPAGFAQLADPYDPTANARYRGYPSRLHDLSYYKGKFYLYFGVVPALMLFWPFVALTGQYLFDAQAVAIFYAVGFLTSVGLLHALWRRYFADVSTGVVAACALALGLATGVPVMLSRCEVYEVAISCGYMLTMLALVAIWCALHQPGRICRWLVAASVLYGLALGARPSLLFGAVVLLVPVAHAWQERRKVWPPLLAAIAPIALIGLALMRYNSLRFDNPFEFGWHYQLAIYRQLAEQYFRPRYLWFNLRIYSLAPVHWSRRFPFVHDLATMAPAPDGHGWVERTFGVLINTPVVWFALSAPLAWRGRSKQEASLLRWFLMSVVSVFGLGALNLSLLPDAYLRYEVEFLPEWMFVAVAGILAVERALAKQPFRRLVTRGGWGLLLGFSVAFNLLASVEQCAEARNSLGIGLVQLGRLPDAIDQYERALQIKPDLAEAESNMGNALAQLGQRQDALAHYDQALRLKPEDAETHNNLAVTLMGLGRFPEAIDQYQQAIRLKPDYVEAEFNLGLAFQMAGRATEAIEHYRQALRLKPEFAQAQSALARLQAHQ